MREYSTQSRFIGALWFVVLLLQARDRCIVGDKRRSTISTVVRHKHVLRTKCLTFALTVFLGFSYPLCHIHLTLVTHVHALLWYIISWIISWFPIWFNIAIRPYFSNSFNENYFFIVLAFKARYSWSCFCKCKLTHPDQGWGMLAITWGDVAKCAT